MEAIVEYNYDAQEPDELTIRKGDIIKDVKLLNGGWWEGTLREKRGMFPDNFVKLLESPGSARNSGDRLMKQEEVTLRNGSGRKFCKVLFSYEPCNDDELKLVPEESIEYLGEVEEGWWQGRIKGRIGVFPSNFVSPPSPEEAERVKDIKKEMCRVLFPYEAANEDELTIAEGDIITLLSRDAPDKGWWKGELKGQIGLFPDNFVEVITVKNENQQNEGLINQVPLLKSSSKNQSSSRKKETANARKSLDVKNVRANEGIVKKIANPSSNLTSHSGTSEKKSPSNTLISSLKRLVLENNNSTNGSNGSSTNTGLGDELDEVERGEGAPLSHLTASRAKAPRRRLPSAQRLKHNNSSSVDQSGINETSPTSVDENIPNGNSEVFEGTGKSDKTDGLVAKSRKKAPWVEELKLNQLERKKVIEQTDKSETKKDRVFSWLPSSATSPDSSKNDIDGNDLKGKEKSQFAENLLSLDPLPFSPLSPHSSTPAYVPYQLFSQLLDRVTTLEENQIILQKKVHQLSDQLAPLIGNQVSDEK